MSWLPASGYEDLLRHPVEGSRFLVMPTLTLGIPMMAVFVRYIRTEFLENLGKDFVRTARSKGLSETHVALRHTLRNALIPVITMIGLQFSRLLGGAVIVEAIFAWPGMGSLIVMAIQARDYATVQGSLVVLGGLFVLVSLFTDLCYGALDPRIRLA